MINQPQSQTTQPQSQPQQPSTQPVQPQPTQPIQTQPTQAQPTQPQTTQPQPPPTQPQPTKGKKSCWIACLIALVVVIILGILTWFVFRPMFFHWLCRKGAQEQGIIKIDEDVYYKACLKKYHIGQ